jgi:hypothetical protein
VPTGYPLGRLALCLPERASEPGLRSRSLGTTFERVDRGPAHARLCGARRKRAPDRGPVPGFVRCGRTMRWGPDACCSLGAGLPGLLRGWSQLPNQRARRLEPKRSFSAIRAADGGLNVPVFEGPDRKSMSTLPIRP